MFNFFIVVLAYFLIASMVAVGVIGSSPAVLRPLLNAPRDAFKLLISRRLRRHHAIEHATINILNRRHRSIGLTEMPTAEGFSLRGRIPVEAVASAVQEAIRRLKNNERALAINPRCPTALVAGQLGLAISGSVILLLIDQFNVPGFLIVLLAAALIGPRLSPYLQRFLLTTPNVAALTLADIEVEQPGGRLGMVTLLVYSTINVRLRESGTGRRGGGDVTLITPDRQEIEIGDYRLRD